MRSIIIGFTLGILLLQQQASLMDRHLLIVLACLAGIIVLFAYLIPRSIFHYVALFFSGGIIGWVWASLLASHALSDQLPPQLEEKELTVVGVIASLPSQVEYGQRFQFLVEQVLTEHVDAQLVPSKIQLGLYAPRKKMEEGNDDATQIEAIPPLQPGERWQYKVRLRRPHGLANPHGFDYEVWLLEQGIGATGSVKNDAENHRITEFVFSINNCIEWARGKLREHILTALPNQPYAPIIVALVIGEQNAITKDDWDVFTRTGVGHLISISGLHVTLLSGMFASLMFFLWRKSFFTRAQLPLRLPAQKVAALSGVLMALLYVALAGFGVPAQRTLIMVSVAALACWLDRIASLTNVLCLALGLVLLVDPWAVLSPGFWLSFSAVGFLFYVSLGRRELKKEEYAPLNSSQVSLKNKLKNKLLLQLHQASVTQYAITLGLVPLTMLLFSQVSLVSPIANAIAIPVVSFVVTPLALIGSVFPDPLGSFVLMLTNSVLQELIYFLSWLSEFQWAVWQAPRPEMWMFICALIGTAWCLSPKGWPLRWAGLIAWLPLALNSSVYPDANQFKVTAFDVGQGTAVLIETEKHRLLYDTGAAYSSQSNAGSSVIYPYLKMRGITQLDGMIVSHSDNDHSGGALTLMEQIKLGWVSTSLDSESKLVQIAAQKSQHIRCLEEQQWEWDGVHFEILHPDSAIYANEKSKPNAKSCTLRIANDTHSVLLTGDIEAKQEARLVDHVPEKLASTVLFAPHHGSGTSSTKAFLQAVSPKIAVFQLGYHNRYRHPKSTIWQRYADFGIRRLRTDQSGAITLRVGSDITVEEFRESHARYWYPSQDVE